MILIQRVLSVVIIVMLVRYLYMVGYLGRYSYTLFIYSSMTSSNKASSQNKKIIM